MLTCVRDIKFVYLFHRLLTGIELIIASISKVTNIFKTVARQALDCNTQPAAMQRVL